MQLPVEIGRLQPWRERNVQRHAGARAEPHGAWAAAGTPPVAGAIDKRVRAVDPICIVGEIVAVGDDGRGVACIVANGDAVGVAIDVVATDGDRCAGSPVSGGEDPG